MRAMSVEIPRLVLDTNVALDLFVFCDRASEHLMAALRAGRVQAVVDEPCRAEWLAVLNYPELSLTEEARRDASAAFDRWVSLLPPGAPPQRAWMCVCPDAPTRTTRSSWS
jgi:hypothetical protein